MPSKVKPSTQVIIRDSNGRSTGKTKLVHFTPAGTPTEELEKIYKSTPRKRNIVRRELLKRGQSIPTL
jgi:hypothetical protein|tara:strand:- start:228 stop:431 length:204 start_codon:yes stop_codon:yes gene_type:complete